MCVDAVADTRGATSLPDSLAFLSLAQPSNMGQNLADCKAGRMACDHSKLSTSQAVELDAANRERNVSECRNGFKDCDHSKLTGPQAIALAVADHQRNVSECKDAWHLAMHHD